MTYDKKAASEEFAAKIIKMLKDGTAPWIKPWKAGERFAPFNPVSGTVYTGKNRVILSGLDFADPRWMTFVNAKSQEYKIKKGSKSARIEFWLWKVKQPITDKNGKEIIGDDGKPLTRLVDLNFPRVKVYNVFHASQLLTKDKQDLPPFEIRDLEWIPNERAEKILKNSGAQIFHTQRDQAFYNPFNDEIRIPTKESFKDEGNYYQTALHELIHWTGHKSRTNRLELSPFGSESYAKEELVAEITTWMLCQDLALPYDPGQHAAYVQSWVKNLQEEPEQINRACRDAEDILGYIQKIEQGKDPEWIKRVKKDKIETIEQPESIPVAARQDNDSIIIPINTLTPQEEFSQFLQDQDIITSEQAQSEPPQMDGKTHSVTNSATGKKGAYSARLDNLPKGWVVRHGLEDSGLNWSFTNQKLTEQRKAEFEEQKKAQHSEQNKARTLFDLFDNQEQPKNQPEKKGGLEL